MGEESMKDRVNSYCTRLSVLMASLLALSAVPAVADSQSAERQSTTIAAVANPSDLPSGADVAAGISQVEKWKQELRAELESPDAVQERADSRHAYAALSTAEAEQLFHSQFAEQIEILNEDPARFLSDATIEQTLEDGTAALVTSDDGTELLDAGIPVKATDGEGTSSKVDITLEDAGDEYVPSNPLTEVSLPVNTDKRFQVGEGLGITVVGQEESPGHLFGDKNVFYSEVLPSTDLIASPIAKGLEISDQLRSIESPEALRFELHLPSDANLRSDGDGGAEVVQEGKAIARVPFPTAVDAQGTEVPVSLEIEGNSIVLQVAHHQGDFAYPILVDPTLLEDWYNASWYSGANLQALSDGSWQWGTNANWVYGSTSCIWTCWGSGRGLYVSAESGNHGAGQFGQWTYTPPGSTSYITSAKLEPFWRNNYTNCPRSKYPQPHDYDGLWSSSYGWAPIETNQADEYGKAQPAGYGRSLVIGLGTSEKTAEDKCRRDIMAGGVAVWITDNDMPSWNSKATVADQWIDSTATPVSVSASDPGLGMKYLDLWTTDANGKAFSLVGSSEYGCSGLHASACPSSWSSQITNYKPSSLPSGVNNMVTIAYDALGSEHASQGLPILLKVDHSAPEIQLSGELLSEHPAKYHLIVTGVDGNSGSFATAQSGMKSLAFYFDGQLAGRYPETESPPACKNVQQGIDMGSCKFENVPVDLARKYTGKHTLKVIATDSLGHSSEKVLELNLPADTTPPTLTPSGSLYAAAGNWILPSELSATAEAQDGETGVVEENLYIDGKLIGQAAKQGCEYGGCGLTHAFAASLSGYADGAHTVKLIAKDGAGNTAERTWTVKTDTTAPKLEPISSPEVPMGWMPQVSSAKFSYSASDSGAGIKKVEVITPTPSGGTLKSTPYSSACAGTEASPCSASVNGNTSVNTEAMAQGIDTISIKAYDAFEHVSSAQTVIVHVDRSVPIVSAVGPLASAPSSALIGLSSELALSVKDSGSGVGSAELLLDGQLQQALSLEEIIESGGSESCKGETCELKYAFSPLIGEMVTPGHHTFSLIVYDKAGQSATVTHEVTLDTRPPNVVLGGPLWEAVGEALRSESALLEAAANDGSEEFASGIANVEIEVDGVPVEPKARLYVADKGNNRIEVFGDGGEFISKFGSGGSGDGQLSEPKDVAVDAKGNVWVADGGNSRVEEFDPEGKFIRKFGSYGTAQGQFSYGGPEGIAIDLKGHVWIADTLNARLQEFSGSGEFLKSVGTFGFGKGQLGDPAGIAIGPGGNIWVADWYDNRVSEFSESGEFIRQFGVVGSGPGQFNRPDAISVDAKGTVWVADEENSRVERFTETGEFISQVGTKGSGKGQFGFGFPIGMVTDTQGNIWIGDSYNNRVQKWNWDGSSAGPEYMSSFGSPGSADGQLRHPAGMAIVLTGGCGAEVCPKQRAKNYLYGEGQWGSGSRSVVVTATDSAGNTNSEEVKVNEPLSAVAPECPTAEPKQLSGGKTRSASEAVGAIEAALPSALAPSEPYTGEKEAEAAEEAEIDPAVTRSAPGVSLDEKGIDVVGSTMGGGVEDEASGSFTVAQAVCMQPLQAGAAASTPTVVEDAAVVYPNALPDTDTVVRPTALGTDIIEYLRGAAAPESFSWAVRLQPDEELVELANGSVAVVRPKGSDIEPEEVPAAPTGGPASVNDVAEQVQQAEHDLVAANNQVTGEIVAVISSPEVLTSSGEVVSGNLRIGAGNVVVAELPPNTVAEAEALIIKANPPAEPEDICAGILTRAPQYYAAVCGPDLPEEPGEDSGDNLTLQTLSEGLEPALSESISAAVAHYEAATSPFATTSSTGYSSHTGAEKRYCERHSYECIVFFHDALIAAELEGELFNVPDGSYDTRANAFRHSFWAAMMTEDQGEWDGGIALALAHEGGEWQSHRSSVRKASRMDILNDFVGYKHLKSDRIATCEAMLDKAGEALYIGAEVDPFVWMRKVNYYYHHLIFRKRLDLTRPGATGRVVVRNGYTCQERY
jgi:sugar lactone lactonase YvrE